MAHTDAEARQQLLDALAEAADRLGAALAALEGAYEQLDDHQGERLEEELFRPVQRAYGRAQRTHAAFAARSGLPRRTFEPAPAGLPSTGVKGFVERAVTEVGQADAQLVALQDSLMPIEVGDADLRAGLSDVRELIAGVAGRAHELVRTFGR